MFNLGPVFTGYAYIQDTGSLCTHLYHQPALVPSMFFLPLSPAWPDLECFKIEMVCILQILPSRQC